MRNLLQLLLLFFATCLSAQQPLDFIDIMNWKLELPSGYTASDWKLSNFQNDKFAQDFFYLDSIDGSLVMEAYPILGTKSTASYTKNTLREQMTPGSSSDNWLFTDGAYLEAEMEVASMSQEGKKYDRTILITLHGRTTDEQTKALGLDKSASQPLVKIFWQDERIRVQRKVLEDPLMKGDKIFDKEYWEDDPGRYFNKKVGFEKFKIYVKIEEGRIEIGLDDQKPIIYRDLSVEKMLFENYFEVGNYLQTTALAAKSTVKIYKLKVSHE